MKECKYFFFRDTFDICICTYDLHMPRLSSCTSRDIDSCSSFATINIFWCEWISSTLREKGLLFLIGWFHKVSNFGEKNFLHVSIKGCESMYVFPIIRLVEKKVVTCWEMWARKLQLSWQKSVTYVIMKIIRWICRKCVVSWSLNC